MPLKSDLRSLACLIGMLVSNVLGYALETKPVDVRSYPTLQAAIDANPGRMIQIPEGDYEINSALKITTPQTGLYGPARIIQTNPGEAILVIENTTGARVENLSLARPKTDAVARDHGLLISKCQDVVITGVRVTENHTHTSIIARDSRDVTIENCTVINYKGIRIDDRTAAKELYGFAFRAIDGNGIQFRNTEGGIIRGNRIQEHSFLATRTIRDQYALGELTVVPAVPGRLMTEDIVRSKYTNNWHQGAGIQVSGPTISRRLLITGNYIENAAQGIDLHCDYAVVSGNIITNAMIGLKATHGAKHLSITDNQFSRIDLWGLLLMPGAQSRSFANNTESTPAAPENHDGGTIVANNVFSEFGYGDQLWNWIERPGTSGERNVIAILAGQLEENPPIHDVLVIGNLVYDSGRDGVKIDGKWERQSPRYFHALYVEPSREPKPVNVQVSNNMFSPGIQDEPPATR